MFLYPLFISVLCPKITYFKGHIVTLNYKAFGKIFESCTFNTKIVHKLGRATEVEKESGSGGGDKMQTDIVQTQ
jgi:hypothetical protein